MKDGAVPVERGKCVRPKLPRKVIRVCRYIIYGHGWMYDEHGSMYEIRSPFDIGVETRGVC